MLRNFKKSLAVFISLIILATSLSACGGKTEDSSSTGSKDGVTDPSKLSPVELVWYVVGDPHGDGSHTMARSMRYLVHQKNTRRQVFSIGKT